MALGRILLGIHWLDVAEWVNLRLRVRSDGHRLVVLVQPRLLTHQRLLNLTYLDCISVVLKRDQGRLSAAEPTGLRVHSLVGRYRDHGLLGRDRVGLLLLVDEIRVVSRVKIRDTVPLLVGETGVLSVVGFKVARVVQTWSVFHLTLLRPLLLRYLVAVLGVIGYKAIYLVVLLVVSWIRVLLQLSHFSRERLRSTELMNVVTRAA